MEFSMFTGWPCPRSFHWVYEKNFGTLSSVVERSYNGKYGNFHVHRL